MNPVESLERLLAELPAEFGEDPSDTIPRKEFRVIKQRNVRAVHEALWELQQYFGMK